MGACGVKIEEEYLIFYFLVDTVYEQTGEEFFMGNVARGEWVKK